MLIRVLNLSLFSSRVTSICQLRGLFDKRYLLRNYYNHVYQSMKIIEIYVVYPP